MKITKTIRSQSFKQVGIMEVNLRVFAQSVAKRNQLVILDLEIWELDRFEISHGVKNVDN